MKRPLVPDLLNFLSAEVREVILTSSFEKVVFTFLPFYFFTFLPFYLYHMSSAVFPRQPSVLVMLIFLDGNEYREGKDYG